ncbi:A/G-specific adenine glycosylase [Parvicella tangerina]|uniref:Adenine DNA glycosylase n=1 Tax=Parvicella tangerina TaxID=2829795 RepID=A0A916NHZ8_9FLAO|nr:A/G-specific adenine glycosylase [Parvicella tangerina]CAG5084108.1 Adenine DNA glycosylase [Parvicella tangerina]
MNLAEPLLGWYSKEGRDLPWRQNITPYKVWLSEIIMQQTRVAQGLPYFEKFFRELPTIEAFAKADQDQILHLWQGLGYYSRGRNMHVAANQIMETYDGSFPTTFKELKTLKGVGDYTAAAIASIAFNQPKAVVDGNVYRVLSRLFNIDKPIDSSGGKKYFQELADELIDPESPGDYNQAIMDFGAMVCTPKNPLCEKCFLKEKCEAYHDGVVQERPVKSKKVKVSNRYFDYFEVYKGDLIAIQQRDQNDVWKGLYQLPLVEVKNRLEKGAANISQLIDTKGLEISEVYEKKHVLSHQRLHTTFYKVEIDDLKHLNGDYRWVKRNDLHQYAFPKLISNYLFD